MTVLAAIHRVVWPFVAFMQCFWLAALALAEWREDTRTVCLSIALYTLATLCQWAGMSANQAQNQFHRKTYCEDAQA